MISQLIATKIIHTGIKNVTLMLTLINIYQQLTLKASYMLKNRSNRYQIDILLYLYYLLKYIIYDRPALKLHV